MKSLLMIPPAAFVGYAIFFTPWPTYQQLFTPYSHPYVQTESPLVP